MYVSVITLWDQTLARCRLQKSSACQVVLMNAHFQSLVSLIIKKNPMSLTTIDVKSLNGKPVCRVVGWLCHKNQEPVINFSKPVVFDIKYKLCNFLLIKCYKTL